MKSVNKLTVFVLLASFAFVFNMCSKDDDPVNHIVKNQDGEDFDITGFWVGVSPTTGESTGETCSIGDIGISYDAGYSSTIQDFMRYKFSYTLVRSRQLDGGNWINEFDLVCKESADPDFIIVGKTYYTTIFVGRDNDYFNLTFDENLPYPIEGYPYPSSTFPIFRQFK